VSDLAGRQFQLARSSRRRSDLESYQPHALRRVKENKFITEVL
jgi:hypothetical protein